MNYRTFKFDKTKKDEIILFDILYRLNSDSSSKSHKLIDRSSDLVSDYYQQLLDSDLIELKNESNYTLTQSGKDKLTEYGKMFQKFKDLAIFKCVYPEGSAPDDDEPDERFGTINEEANPPVSEDYRIAIFENFSKRQKRHAPLHLFAFFSQIENEPLHSKGEHWLYDLISGKYFNELEDIINTQISAESIAPDGWSDDEIIDVIYEAGMKELNRCFEEDQDKFNQEDLQSNESDFWIEETVYESDCDDYYYRDPYYYDPYWEYDAGIGSALVVGAFAGLATCALLC
jgi:predicted transcriptional regulator